MKVWELLEKLKDADPDVPVVILSENGVLQRVSIAARSTMLTTNHGRVPAFVIEHGESW